MNANQMIQSQQEKWDQLAKLASRAEQHPKGLTPDEVKILGEIYRATTSDLALAQRDFPHHPITKKLNQLVARAHAVIYRGEPLGWQRIKRFIVSGFPTLYRESSRFILISALLFFLPALLAGVTTYFAPDASVWLLPPQAQQLRSSIEEKELWTQIPVEERPYASTFIMQNNIRVSFLAFAGGILAGLMTVWILIFNGLMLGGLTGLTLHYGVGFELWTFVIGHGVIELSVIVIAGGAGLMLGWALLRPGFQRRQYALALAARKAVLLIVSGVPLLVIAGLIEGFLSPAENIDPLVKWAFGLSTGLLLYFYLLRSGRNAKQAVIGS